MPVIHKQLFRNNFVERFNGDESGDLSPRQTPGVLYSKAHPTPVPNPVLIGWSKELARELDIADPTKKDIQILGGNLVTESMRPYAACYAGHQFGNWAGQLGDGRAITLGEWQTNKGTWDLQLKGAGPTAYSRHADGRAVLRSSVREYLMSEAMHHLGVPTTRALSLVTTGEKILRDMFYNGNAAYEPGAVVLRVAPSFIRFGNFEILAARKEIDHLRELVDYTIQRYFPHISGEEKVLSWFKEVVDTTAKLITEWQRVGFVHGVMNTDNMSILGLTIDYGPYSFMDNYDPEFTPNTTDLPGKRYAFGNQPAIGYWNVGRLASAIAPLFEETTALQEALDSYEDIFWENYYQMMGNKLGLDKITEEDKTLIASFEKILAELQPDMTMFYRLLIDLPIKTTSRDQILAHFDETFYRIPEEKESENFSELINSYLQRLQQNSISLEEAREKMKKANPKFILRNYLLHQAIEDLEQGKSQLFEKLQEAMKDPYNEIATEFFMKRPDWATKKAGCSMLSCSS